MVPTEKTAKASEEKQGISAPSITLPKGGGAIHGIGEKFAANPVTGTGSISVPIATSSSRSGFSPQLSLSYDSGAGNGPFGLGWTLSIPSITRKTDKGLPKYQGAEESDVFILSGAEDLVQVLKDKGGGNWVPEKLKPRTVGGVNYQIYRYRPRIEGLFACIERWTNPTDTTDTFWRSISKDNITSWYGKTKASRIVDPTDLTHIFSWLICESYDDKGNVIIYGYEKENSDNIDFSQAHERNRTDKADKLRSANRYLKRIRYGYHKPYLPKLEADSAWPTPPIDNQWFFEIVFDYGDHHKDNPLPKEAEKKWPVRNDPFSNYRAGFEVRTYRLCQRILMFHHFPGELGVEANCLVRSTDFNYSYENDPNGIKNPIYSFLQSVSQTSYKRKEEGGYRSKSLPPVEFEYTQSNIDETIREVEPESLENLPYGMDGSIFQWLDLDGEGLSGILTEQADSWFYKRNLSANPDPKAEYATARFGPLECIATKPNTTISNGKAQFMDLAGDGQTDLVEMESAVRGFYERTFDQDWEPFQAFSSWPNIDTRDPNLKFIDLTGDGHADILISEDQVFIWHASLAESGYGPAQRVQKQFDEEEGPRLIFADLEQSIFLADLSGDGLTDMVRIRNGEVCYWPNLGYCRFGAKVTMDNSPWFDACDQFNPRRIRLADIDGSGTTDILYLHGNGVDIYFNQSGNSWGKRTELPSFPAVDNLAAIQAMDLLGNGTACLVWSSPLPSYANCPMRYIDLMGGQKPHLLKSIKNNLGAKTRIDYAPSTKFYLQDKEKGQPWITKLPFPVHVVEKVTVTDNWRKTRFSSTYSYHHGYFDGAEREFRGFGRVEQVDVESYGKFEQGNANSPYITPDKTLYQPPVKTVTWYHTGAFLDRERILSQFENEYFPKWFEDLKPDKDNVLGGLQENILPNPDLDAQDLGVEEWREALRACKGMMLRQEVYELDVEALEKREHRLVKLYSTAYHNCHIRRLQPRATNPNAVFLVAESEAISYHYELDLTHDDIFPDPRITHTLNLKYDEYANVLQSVAVVYSRSGQFEDGSLKGDEITLIRDVQRETHLAYTETRYTEDFGTQPEDKEAALDNRRLRVPCEVLTYELTGIKIQAGSYFSLENLRNYKLSPVYPASGTDLKEVETLAYHELPDREIPPKVEKRFVEHARTLFFKENLIHPLPFKQHGRLGLAYEAYKLALADDLLDAVFKDSTGKNKLEEVVNGTTARGQLQDAKRSGYLSGADLIARFTPPPEIPTEELAGQYWIRSGIAGFAPDAAQHFYLPEKYTDPFGNVTTLEYDPRDLFIKSSTDAMQNKTEVIRFDFRVLAPSEMKDINDNLSEVYFDALGLPTAMAVKGKGTEGDNLIGFNDDLASPSLDKLTEFFVTKKPYDETQASDWLGNATARHVYYFGEIEEKLPDGTPVIRPDGKPAIRWGQNPACACGVLRERHVSQLAPGKKSPLQTGFEYSDGLGSVIVKKVQAEPEADGQPLRWVASGKTILNNKGKPVKQYEPYFCPPDVGHRFEDPPEVGVTPVIYYDAVGRVVRTEMPDGTYSWVEFSPWHVRSFDQNDTVKEEDNAWFARKSVGTTEERRAVQLAAEHADTPALTILDSLGREVISIAHNKYKDVNTGVLKDEKYLTYTKLDAEGKPLWIRDARKNLVMQYINPPVPNNQAADPAVGFTPCYDIAGNLLFQHSMDAGDRWMLNDAAGKPMLAWDSRGHTFRTDYDALHRPTGSLVKGADPEDPDKIIQFEKVIYGDTPNNGLVVDPDHPENDQTKQLNLRGQPYKQYDTAGLVTSIGRSPVTGQDEAFDFKGNPLRSMRQLSSNYKATPNWSEEPDLEAEIFTSSTRYDALNRPIQLIAPHSSQAGIKLNVIRLGYNEAGLLERMDVWLEQQGEPAALLDIDTATRHIVTDIDYNAKGQRELIAYGNGVTTQYEYDEFTFRLNHLQTLRGADALQNLFYTYDPVGNITQIRDEAQDTVFHSNDCVKPGAEYRYDALYRLIGASGREHKGGDQQTDWDNSMRIVHAIPNDCQALRNYIETYRYDAVGNILQMLHHPGRDLDQPGQPIWNRCYQYAVDSNRLLATRLPGEPDTQDDYTAMPGYGAKYTYDVHGSMTSMSHLPVMEWDFKDQLRSSQRQVVNDPPPPDKVPETTYYVYDAGGQRVRKVTERQNGARKEERIYLGGFEVYRKYNGQTVTLERETLHVMDDKQRVALIETRTRGDDPAPLQLVRYQLSNHLGSATLELSDQAQVISYEEYHPYGTTAYQAARNNIDTPKRYRYTGKERDEETGFSYHGARYYAPWLGRWTACDPKPTLEVAFGDGSSLTPYAYASGRPTVRVDLNGADDTDPQYLSDLRNPPGGRFQAIADDFKTHGVTNTILHRLTNGRVTQVWGDNASKVTNFSRFTELGWARKAFLAGTVGAPFEPPTDPADKAEWERGEALAVITIAAEMAASGGGVVPPTHPQAVPVTGIVPGKVASVPLGPPLYLVSKKKEDNKATKETPESPPTEGSAPSDGPGKRVEIARSQVGTSLRTQSFFSGKTIRYENGRAYIEEYRLIDKVTGDPVDFDRFQDGILGDVKDNYAFLVKMGSKKAADALLKEAGRQVQVAKQHGLSVEWYVRADSVEGFKGLLKDKYPEITIKEWKGGNNTR